MFNAQKNSMLALILATGLPAAAQAQSPKITGLGQLWYHQMMDNNLRAGLNSNSPYGSYYNLSSRYRENGFLFRRAEIKAAASITGNIDYEIMLDPATSGGDNFLNMLQDFVIRYKLPHNFEIRAGQFKNLQTLEGATSSSDLLLAERSMLAVRFGDVRERGVAVSVGFGKPDAFGGRFHVGYFNGSAKSATDNNAQKDIAARLEMNYGKDHAFGVYTLQGANNQNAAGQTAVGSFVGAPDTEAFRNSVIDNGDKISDLGAFYRYQTKSIHASAEIITGALGRRFQALGVSSAARQHLDQKFMGYTATFAYIFGKHSLVARYDNMNYNAGDDWYTDYNPYTHTAPDTPRNADYTPNFTEITLGYTYAFNPERIRQANIKVNYINRSKNFLQPRSGQSGEQGGDSIVIAFQVAF